MSDRGFLFLFSVLMIAGSGATAAYLVATGQAATVDGLFLVLTALIVAAGFALYVKYMIDQAMAPPPPAPKAQPAKAPAKEAPTKTAPVES